MATFEELQRAFVDRLGGASVSDLEEGTIVVLPSATFALTELGLRLLPRTAKT